MGSYELGGQLAPPVACGFTITGSSQNGVKIRPPFTSLKPSGDDVDLVRDDRVTDRIRLRRRCRLAGLLRHGPLLDADQRLAGCRDRGCR